MHDFIEASCWGVSSGVLGLVLGSLGDACIRAFICAAMIPANRLTWKWPRGSRIRIAALLPPMGIEKRVGGRMARAVIK